MKLNLKKILSVATIVSAFTSAPVFSESGAVFTLNAMAVDTSADSNFGFNLGGGYRFNEHFALDLGYNYFGDPYFGLDVYSINYGITVGAKATKNVSVMLLGGAESLRASGRAFGRSISVSGSEAYWGLGFEYRQRHDLSTRLRFVSHDSGDLRTLQIGLVYHF